MRITTIQLTTIFQRSRHRSKIFLQLEKEYQAMIAKEAVGGGSMAFSNIGLPST